MPCVMHRYLAVVLAIAVLTSISITAANSDEHSSADSHQLYLFEELAKAETEQEGRIAETAIWQFWFSLSPTPDVRKSLDAGIARREAYDFEAAENHLNKVVESAPNYAEGYNQRAFVRFLRENYDEAQTDLETALKLEPHHFGAMSGLFHILRRQNRHAVAMKMLQEAVDIHPWLKERSALPENLWPERYRGLHESGQRI